MLYKFAHGSQIGTLSFVYGKFNRMLMMLSYNLLSILPGPLGKTFWINVIICLIHQMCVLQNIYTSLIEDASSSKHVAEKEIDECVIKALIDLDDAQKINGNDKMSEYL